MLLSRRVQAVGLRRTGANSPYLREECESVLADVVSHPILHHRAFCLASSTSTPVKRVLSIQSHVVYGAAGNSAAVFPMRRLGIEVWPLNTVQFSNHTQYGAWEGMVMPSEQISALVSGIEARGVLGKCDAVLSGYLGSEAQGAQVIHVVDRVRAANPKALYVCDPVMGHPEKGCVVPQGVQTHHAEHSAMAADVLCPNVLELGIITGAELSSIEQVIEAAHHVMGAGRAQMVLVKHLAHAGLSASGQFEMLLVCKQGGAWHVACPMLHFDRPPVGVGDLTSAVFLARLVSGDAPSRALEHTMGVYNAVMQTTHAANAYELQLVRAQKEIESPSLRFEASFLPKSTCS